MATPPPQKKKKNIPHKQIRYIYYESPVTSNVDFVNSFSLIYQSSIVIHRMEYCANEST